MFKSIVFSCMLLNPASYAQEKSSQPHIQIALLLDTSNSMDGLINQARTQLWSVVNELARSKRGGQVPILQVALYEYGKSSLDQASGYVRMVLPLTTDLDRVSESLFALTTNGGDEYCGLVIGKSTRDLAWSTSDKDYKALFIAGNEPFDQGPSAYAETCRAAIAQGIIVNTIFCGDESEGIQTHWKHGAELADGRYMFIDQNQPQVAIATPFDDEILQLGADLNTTYMAYGAAGSAAKRRQEAQDVAAEEAAPEAAVQRAASKASVHYRNDSWDLVDAVASGEVDLDEAPASALPEPMREKSIEERKQLVEEASQKRQEIQTKLNQLRKQRLDYVEANSPDRDDHSLKAALVTAITDQLTEKKFTVESD